MLKNLKKFAVCIFVMISFLQVGISQGFSIDSLAAREARFMKEKLTLNDAVYAKVQALTGKHMRKIDSLSKLNTDSTFKKQTIRVEKIQYFERLKSLLTPKQYKSYQDLISERKKIVKQHAKATGRKIKDDDTF